MNLYVYPAGGDIFDLEWPDGWRIPVAGELLLIGPDEYQVILVQWELHQGSDAPSVQLRVTDV